jgi:hypothetical protein
LVNTIELAATTWAATACAATAAAKALAGLRIEHWAGTKAGAEGLSILLVLFVVG